MIAKSFIQASIALIILASSLPSSVNATAIAPGPARQFLFLGLIGRGELVLTSNPGFARKTDGSVAFSRSAPIAYRQNFPPTTIRPINDPENYDNHETECFDANEDAACNEL